MIISIASCVRDYTKNQFKSEGKRKRAKGAYDTMNFIRPPFSSMLLPLILSSL